MTSRRRRYVASTSLRLHVPAGNLAPHLAPPPPQYSKLWSPQYSKPSYACVLNTIGCRYRCIHFVRHIFCFSEILLSADKIEALAPAYLQSKGTKEQSGRSTPHRRRKRGASPPPPTPPIILEVGGGGNIPFGPPNNPPTFSSNVYVKQ